MWANVKGIDDARNYLAILYNGLVCVFTEPNLYFYGCLQKIMKVLNLGIQSCKYEVIVALGLFLFEF